MAQLAQSERVRAQEHPFYHGMDEGDITFVAHRGGDGGYENTHQAFEAALSSDITVIETDIHCTSDDVPIHFHGDRHTKQLLRQIPFAELNTPRSHSLLGLHGCDSDIHIPALEDTLTQFPTAKFFLDLKSRRTSLPVAEVIKRTGAQDRVSVDGIRQKRAVAVAKELPGEISVTINPIELLVLYGTIHNITGNNSHRMPGLKTLRNRWLQHATSLSISIRTVQPAVISMARELEIPVFVHHVKTEFDIKRAVSLGARGVMVDKLDLRNTGVQR